MDTDTQKPVDPVPYTSQEAVDLIYDTLECLHQVLTENQISYTIFSGTALGAERHGGLIPWDDDGDIIILSDDEQRFVALKDKFAQRGFTLGHEPFFGHRLYHTLLAQPRPFDQYPYPFVDIFLVHDTGTRYELTTDEAREYWPQNPLPYGCFNRLVDVPFGHLMLRGLTPKDSIQHLDEQYGKDWPSVARRDVDHYFYENVPTVDVSLKEEINRRPARHSKHPRSVQPLKPMDNQKSWSSLQPSVYLLFVPLGFCVQREFY